MSLSYLPLSTNDSDKLSVGVTILENTKRAFSLEQTKERVFCLFLSKII